MFGVLLVSVCIHDRRERVQRKLFTAIRQCTVTGLRILDERAKMVTVYNNTLAQCFTHLAIPVALTFERICVFANCLPCWSFKHKLKFFVGSANCLETVVKILLN
jgi:hypothetical protein